MPTQLSCIVGNVGASFERHILTFYPFNTLTVIKTNVAEPESLFFFYFPDNCSFLKRVP